MMNSQPYEQGEATCPVSAVVPTLGIVGFQVGFSCTSHLTLVEVSFLAHDGSASDRTAMEEVFDPTMTSNRQL